MPKIAAKNATILVNGYNFSTYFTAYEASNSVNPRDVTGFGDGCKNFIPTIRSGKITGSALWDSAAAKTHLILKSLPTGHVTIIPETYTVGVNSVSLPFMLNNYNPQGKPDDAIRLGSLNFEAYGSNVGVEEGWVLQHASITSTTTSTGVLDPENAALTTTCSATLHVWSATATDTYVIKVQHSTDNSTYADLITFTANGTSLTSERIAVASGTVNKYRRVVATRTGAAGNTLGFTVHFQRQNT